jgi:hypothetical protein
MPALFCSLAVLLCELISRPYADMGICDDGPYILVAKNLAATGHIAYNGWSAAMLVWQLYLGAGLIKLFGFSYTTVRMSTLLVAVLLPFFLQRSMVRASISERNATLGTLALVLSPLYLLLSATFMSDIHGLFAIVLCLYGCLRALQAATPRAAIGWLCFALATNGICGTSRQLAWLGIFIMVPSTLWLLRGQRRVFLAGVVANLAGVGFILGCMLWLKHQPYTTPETLRISHVAVWYLVTQFTYLFLDVPFLLLPVTVLFLPEIRKSKPRILAIVVALLLSYLFLAVYPSHLRGSFSYLLEPTLRQLGSDWITPYGAYGGLSHGTPLVLLPTWIMALTTVAILASLFGLGLSLFRSDSKPGSDQAFGETTWKQLFIVLGPFATAYIFLLVYRAASVSNDHTGMLFDRYALGFLLVPLICLVRHYQERVRSRIPVFAVFLIAIMAVFGTAVTHNTFALYRARVAIAAELRSARVSEASVDNGWEYNLGVELQHARYINNFVIVFPADAYVIRPPLPSGTCSAIYLQMTPVIRPVYGVSFDPNACYGPAPFAPVHYSRWLAATSGTLYVIRYTPASKP